MDPLVAPLKGIAAGGVIVVVFKDVSAAEVELHADVSQQLVDRGFQIRAFIQRAEHEADEGAARHARLVIRVNTGVDVGSVFQQRVILIPGVIDLISVFTAALGNIQRFIRPLEQIRIGGGVDRRQCRADGEGHAQIRHQLFQHGAEIFQQQRTALFHDLRIGHILQQNEEFIAADAAENVLRAEQAAQAGADLRENGVAVQVSVAIVHRLEVVHIQNQHGGQGLAVQRAQMLRDQLLGGSLVQQLGQRVELGLFLQCDGGALKLIHIIYNAHDAVDLPGTVTLQLCVDPAPSVLSVPVDHPHLQRHLPLLTQTQRLHPRQQRRVIVRVEAAGPAQPLQKMLENGRIAKEFLTVRRAAQCICVQIQLENDALALIDQQPMALHFRFQTVDGPADLGVVTNGEIHILLPVGLGVNTASGQHPDGLGLLAQQTELGVCAAALLHMLLHGRGKGGAVGRVDQPEKFGGKELLHFPAAVTRQNEQIIGAGIDGQRTVAAAAQRGAHQTVQRRRGMQRRTNRRFAAGTCPLVPDSDDDALIRIAGIDPQENQLVGLIVPLCGTVDAAGEHPPTQIQSEEILRKTAVHLLDHAHVVRVDVAGVQLCNDLTEGRSGNDGIQVRIGVIDHMVQVVVQIQLQHGGIQIMQHRLIFHL